MKAFNEAYHIIRLLITVAIYSFFSVIRQKGEERTDGIRFSMWCIYCEIITVMYSHISLWEKVECKYFHVLFNF